MSSKIKLSMSPIIKRLAYNVDELMAVTGLSRTTIWRLEQRGLLRSVPGIRSKLYTDKSIEEFLNGTAKGGSK
jgi:predicted DNA-binding transcriptional regulator AlpA